MTESTPPPAWRIAIPSSITLAGIFFGLLAVALAASRPYGACLAIIGASLCDMLDGRVARMTRARSAFGAELDSLADIVSFGLAPAWLAYRWSLAPGASDGFDPWLLVVFVFVGAGAIRLARFNVAAESDPRSPIDEFEGLPIPMAAMLCVTPIMTSLELGLDPIRDPGVMAGIVLLGAGLMVSRLPLPSYKRFSSRPLMVTFYGLIAGGLTMLWLGLPGGTVLLGFTVLYLLIGTWRRATRSTGRIE